jgi:cell division protein FtsZ
VKKIMYGQGSALMGIGRASGEARAATAAKMAIASPLLEVSIEGARGILMNVTGGPNLGMLEVAEAAKVVTEKADEGATVIFGTVIDETMKDEIKVTVVATGFDGQERSQMTSSMKSVLSAGSISAPRPAPFARPAEPKQEKPQEAAPAPQPSYEPPKAQTLPKRIKPIEPEPQQRFRPAAPAPAAVGAARDAAEEELDIPAFIRKKML